METRGDRKVGFPGGTKNASSETIAGRRAIIARKIVVLRLRPSDITDRAFAMIDEPTLSVACVFAKHELELCASNNPLLRQAATWCSSDGA